jgi:dipeptidyl aminopeptidase/acylaminoacyl peptidase
MEIQKYLGLVMLCGGWLLCASPLRSQLAPTPREITEIKKAVSVDDAIGLTQLADPAYLLSGNSDGRVAQFSPNGRHFVVVLRRGIVTENVNAYSIYLFQTQTLVYDPRPKPMLAMKSSSNRPAIAQWAWLRDNRTLLFIGETSGKTPQICALDTVSRHLTQLTHNATPIVSFRATKDGKHIVFLAEPASTPSSDKPITISDQRLDDLLIGKTKPNPDRLELFALTEGAIPVEIPSQVVWNQDAVSLSPDGRYAVVATQLTAGDLPREWGDYEYPGYYKAEVIAYFHALYKATPTAFTKYYLLDTSAHTLSPLWAGPQIGGATLSWSSDSHSLFMKGAYLPLNGADRLTRRERLRKTLDVEINVPDGTWRVMADHVWAAGKPAAPLRVTMTETLNDPPRIYAETLDGRTHKLLLDLNPQLGRLALGTAETMTWTVKGIQVIGGLYYPPGYVPGRKYPLVIQSHGFVPTQFSMDGRSEWSSNFAARPLAAQGILVLQAFSFESTADHDAVASDRSLGATAQLSYARFESLAYDAAIEDLARRGIVDESRVGVAGFSRTVWFVAYALTHSLHHYRAAILTDGIDGGYFQYIAYRATEMESDNGGVRPFTRSGLEQWLEVSPGFNLDKVNTPIRLVALDRPGILEAWEWFAALQLQGKPVDFVALHDGAHILERPSDRKAAMEGVVDWFAFWLCGKRDPAPDKVAQYRRWQKMQDMSAHVRTEK